MQPDEQNKYPVAADSNRWKKYPNPALEPYYEDVQKKMTGKTVIWLTLASVFTYNES
ncbi:hypothetical protein GCM10008022_30610 [Paenibacillus hunanensis]|uniref:Uncharacterized protein n=1 Tax=Paenibacillus hunanensis TaxID=539262 RepID=A0ABU1IYX7_9BACL|nr:hypothetical protein [Paenibacillus hunanensis]GGJ19329.1 hypothetical protein GCM10008022_30610 [Paenibacillus hunanensis]